jgi:hypothetical protein
LRRGRDEHFAHQQVGNYAERRRECRGVDPFGHDHLLDVEFEFDASETAAARLPAAAGERD